MNTSLVYVAVGVVMLIGAAIIRRRRDAMRVADRFVQRVAETVPAQRHDEARSIRAVLKELIAVEGIHNVENSKLAAAADERMGSMDAAERVFGGSRRFYGITFLCWDVLAQVAVNWITFANRNLVAVVASGVIFSFGPALVAGFIAELSFRLFARRPENVRRILDFTAWTLGGAAIISLLFIALARAAGFGLGVIEEILPLVVNVLASAGGIAGGVMLAVHRHLHAAQRYSKAVARADRASRLYEEALTRIDEIDPPALPPAVVTEIVRDNRDDEQPLGGAPAAPAGRPISPVMRAVGAAAIALVTGASTIQAQSRDECLWSLDASNSSASAEMADATKRLVKSLPSFVERFGCEGGLRVMRFTRDTLWMERRQYSVPGLPPQLQDCQKVRPAPPANAYAEVFRLTVRGAADRAVKTAITACRRKRESVASSVARARAALRDSVSRRLAELSPMYGADRSAIADQIAYAVARRFAGVVILTDAVETVKKTLDPLVIPESMVVVLLIVPTSDRFGGRDETNRWAAQFAEKIPRLIVMPYLEVDGGLFWLASSRFRSAGAAPPKVF